MKVVIDTSSLLAFVRYYLPFDRDNTLFDFIKDKIEIGEIILIDKVIQQCRYLSKGIVLSVLPYLADKEFLKSANAPFKTSDLTIPKPKQFFHFLSADFCNLDVKKNQGLTEAEFETKRDEFLEDADMKLVILCLNLIKVGEKDVILVTEETVTHNDNKLFKKIPSICGTLNISTMNLPELLGLYSNELSITYSLKITSSHKTVIFEEE